MFPIKQSTAVTIPVFVHNASGDAVTGLSDGSFTKRISKAGGAFAAMTVTLTEMENGWYALPLSTAHTDTVGVLSITLTNAGAKQVNIQLRVHANLPDDLPASVWASGTRTLTSFGTLADDVWASASRTLTAFGFSVTVGTNNDKTGYALSAAAVQAIWEYTTRTLTSFGTLVSDIWSNATRTLSAFGFSVTVGTNNDKTGYALSTGSEDAVVDKVWDEARSGHTTAGTFGEGAASVQGNVTGSVDSVTDPVTVGTNNDKTGYALSTAGEDAVVDKVWDEARAGHTTAGSFGQGVASVQGDVTGNVGGNVVGSVDSVTDPVTVGTNNDKTGYTVSTVSDKTGYSLADDALTEAKGTAGFFNRVADHVLRRTYANVRASSYGDAVSFRSLLGGLAKLVNKWSISGTTLTVTHEDDSTTAGTQTLSTTASADAVTGVDTN